MIIRQYDIDQFFDFFPKAVTAYGSKAFCQLNASKAEAVRGFVSLDGIEASPRMGLVAGYRQGEWHAPFSAPFAEIYAQKNQSLDHIYDFISELADTLCGTTLNITLPPAFYHHSWLTPLYGVLANYASKTYWDYSYYFDLRQDAAYDTICDRAGRKNLHRALEAGFQCRECSLGEAYAVIRANRESHGYYLAMTLDQVLATSQIIPAHALALSLDGKDVAAAIMFDTAKDITQVVYWGDVPGYSQHRPMNLLALRVMEHSQRRGVDIVDVGPASTRGVPNHGLCAFKTSIGCQMALKPSFVI